MRVLVSLLKILYKFFDHMAIYAHMAGHMAARKCHVVLKILYFALKLVPFLFVDHGKNKECHFQTSKAST